MTSPLDHFRLLPRPVRVTALGSRVARVPPQAHESLANVPLRGVDRPLPWFAQRLTFGWCAADEREAQGYRLRLDADARGDLVVEIESPAIVGLRMARATLAQILEQAPAQVPTVLIEDRPAFATRGVMLDVSRCRVPTREELLRLVPLLAGIKINHLQLYTEHTFAYRDHTDAWQDASPITHDDVLALDEACSEHGIELAANQNCFGHLAGWLRLPAYAHLAETHGDWLFDVWPRSGPFSLCPTDPRSRTFVQGLLEELLPLFRSGLVNIGCDETYDIAFGRSREEVSRRGRLAVYLDFVGQIAEIAAKLGKRSMFWADIALSNPELLRSMIEASAPDAALRRAIALTWSYEPDGPFGAWCRACAGAGLEPWVCPGTSSWRTFLGRTSERVGNQQVAAQQGRDAGARGYLVCDWGDLGHRQPWAVSAVGLASAAGLAWNPEAPVEPEACSRWMLGSERPGAALDALGDVDRPLREVAGALSRPDHTRLRNASALFADLHVPLREKLAVAPLEAWRGVRESLKSAVVPPGLSSLDAAEMEGAIEMARIAAERAVRRREGTLTPAIAAVLADRVLELSERRGALWLRRAREGGLAQSQAYERAIAEELRALSGGGAQ